jgi:Cysteine rich repeat
MQRLLGLAAATALILSATLVHAAEMTGYVNDINTTQNSLVVGDTLFTASPSNTVGTALADLKVGDKVSVRYHESGSGHQADASNAIAIVLLEPAVAPPVATLAAYVEEACNTELGAYCSQVIPGQNRQLACLYAHGDKLSGQCEKALYESVSVLDRAISTIAYLADQCRADIESKCAYVQPGQGRIAHCLAAHKDSLSQPCTEAITVTRTQIE